MKRLRHYNKDLAIVLSVFGSSEADAMAQYMDLYDEIKNNIKPEIELRIAVSSRTVLKKLEAKGELYLTLPEQLANLDKLGYKKVIVVSVNIFPTEEHDYIVKVVDSFNKNISIAKYEITMPLFTKAKATNNYLKNLSELLQKEYNSSNLLFVAHGTSSLITSGISTYTYVRDYLKQLNPKNYFYTLEGIFPYSKDHFLHEIPKNRDCEPYTNGVLIVPLLLVTGNHNKNDILEIKDELSESMEIVEIAKTKKTNSQLSLLQLEETKKYFVSQVNEAVEKINW